MTVSDASCSPAAKKPAAGADIKEMQPKGFIDMFVDAAIGGDRVAKCRNRRSPPSAAMRSAAAANSP